jgi:hypothetical protein
MAAVDDQLGVPVVGGHVSNVAKRSPCPFMAYAWSSGCSFKQVLFVKAL